MASLRASPLNLVLVLAAALLLPTAASARAWRGIEPGRTTVEEVVKTFGEPTSRPRAGGRSLLLYKEDVVPAGTKEARFYYRADGVVDEVLVYLATSLDTESIEGEFGKPDRKTFTETFQKVWQYTRKGVTVYFDKDGAVEAIAYVPAAAASKAAPADPKAP
jgi:hypothetical protein